MNYCPNCGYELKSDYTLCPNCNAKLRHSKGFGEIVKCARCEGEGWIFVGNSQGTCPACGGAGVQRV